MKNDRFICYGILLLRLLISIKSASDFRYSRGVLSPERHVRTRLYFTSESHVHSLLSILRYGALCDVSMGYFNLTDKYSS